MNEDLIQSVERALRQRRGTRTRTSGGEHWLDCRCPLHDDAHRSASFSTDQGTFTCRVCSPGASIPLDRVALALVVPNPLQPNGGQPNLTLGRPKIELWRSKYAYFWPNGELSHYHVRVEFVHHPKEFFFMTPQGEWRRPDPYWPLYGDLGLQTGAIVPITEGEKATDAINNLELSFDGSPIRALTAGSVSDLNQSREILLARLRELEPKLVLLWPDNDEPGLKAMRSLHRYLSENQLQVNLLDPGTLNLGEKEDAADFVLKDGDLSLLFKPHLLPAHRGPTPKDIAQQLVVLKTGHVLWPKTEDIARLDQSYCNSMWQQITGHMPSDRQAKELLNLLRAKLYEDPAHVYFRIDARSQYVVWRSDKGGDCYRLSKDGIDRQPEFDSLVVAHDFAVAPTGVEPTDDPGAYRQLFEFFGLGELEQVLTLGWLICVLTGMGAPLLLVRGDANTGKSHFARFILGIVEPTLQEVDATSSKVLQDDRQLIRNLQKVPALLIDNVSSFPTGMEDTLSRLVTGYNMGLRRLYEDSTESIRMKRGIIITTTNWDIYKGDLATRVIAFQPRIEGVERLADEVLEEKFWALYPQIRGYVFTQVCRFYANSWEHRNKMNPWRVASFGWVLQTLGYDVVALHRDEAVAKAGLLNQYDMWMEAIVDIWHKENRGGEFVLSMAQIIEKMRDYGLRHDEVPMLSSTKFPRWAEEKKMLLKDHGFYLERHRSTELRGYWFRRVK